MSDRQPTEEELKQVYEKEQKKKQYYRDYSKKIREKAREYDKLLQIFHEEIAKRDLIIQQLQKQLQAMTIQINSQEGARSLTVPSTPLTPSNGRSLPQLSQQ